MNRVLAVLLMSALALLSACGSDPEPETIAQAPAPADVAPAAPAAPVKEDPTAKMARAVGGGKPGAAVDLKYEIAAKPAVGTPTEVQIALVPSPGVDGMDVTIRGMEGLTLAGSLTASFPQVEPGEPYTHSFSLLPDRTGVFYVSVVVETKIGASSLARTFSIPFVVGDPPAQQKAKPQTDSQGEAIESMKAAEPPPRG